MYCKVLIVGRVGIEPHFIDLGNGKECATFTLATNDYYTTKEGEKKIITEWHNVKVYNPNIVKIVKMGVHCGTRVLLEATIKTETYKNKTTGIERKQTFIVLSSLDHKLKILDKKDDPDKQAYTNNGATASMEQDAVIENGEVEISAPDDEIIY